MFKTGLSHFPAIRKTTCRTLERLFTRDVKTSTSLQPACSPTPFYQGKFKSFSDMLSQEMTDARQLVLVEATSSFINFHSPETLSQIFDCEVQDVYNYHLGTRSFSLVRFRNFDDFKKITSGSDDPQFTIESRILKINKYPTGIKKVRGDCTRDMVRGRFGSANDLKILSQLHVEDGIEQLVRRHSMTELGSKLRFFFITHLEESICQGFLKNTCLLPFGSSVNGFGDDSSDLDVAMLGNNISKNPTKAKHFSYYSKDVVSERFQSQRMVDFIGDLLQYFTPGILSCVRIPRARIPIVKMSSDVTGLECDLSFFVNASVPTAEALYSYSRLDRRLKKLITFIKLWAKSQHLTQNSGMGPFLTNFQLMMLVIGFFQTQKTSSGKKLLPPMHSLPVEGPFEDELTQDSNDFLSLLCEFFEFICNFEYQYYGISIRNGAIVSKPEHSPLYIENPLDADHNICRNLSRAELSRLVKAAQFSLKTLQGPLPDDFSLAMLCHPISIPTSGPLHTRSKGTRGFNVSDYMYEDEHD